MEESSSSFIDELSKKLKPLTDLVDELHGIGIESLKIKLPTIVVVGEQSTGKSSVLEAIVGEDFLPKSDELATRVPIRLHLKRERDPQCKTFAIINHLDGEIECEMNELASKIREITDEIAGDDFGILNAPIDVDIHGSDVPELTLIDLPGIARNPRPNSDQTEDIEEITKTLIQFYIKEKETIILAVVPANVDPASSDALKMAKQVDKDGDRTIGVVTKIDIMDKGTNARKLLQGEYHVLKLGYVAVKNRSKLDLDRGVSVKQALKQEREYFANHEVYKTMNPLWFGAKNLSLKLMIVLKEQIESSLPIIMKTVQKRKEEIAAILEELGDATPEELADKQRLILSLKKQYINYIDKILEGRFDNLPQCLKQRVETEDLFGAAKIKYIFDFIYCDAINEINISKIQNDEIQKVLNNTMGNSLQDFLPFHAFTSLVSDYIIKVQPCGLDCSDKVFSYVQSIAKDLCKSVFGNYPAYQSLVSRLTENKLSVLKENTNRQIRFLVKSKNCIYTANPEYLNLQKNKSPTQNQNQNQNHNPEKTTAELMKSKLIAYFDGVFKPSIKDSIPQIIQTFLNTVTEELDYSFAEIRAEEISRLLQEPDDKVHRRREKMQEKDILSKASDLLSQFSLN